MIKKINVSEIYSLYRPSKCERRVFLKARGVAESKPSEFDNLIKILGDQHELDHLMQFEKYSNLSRGDLLDRALITVRAVLERNNVIYQGTFISRFSSMGVDVIGIPDFLIRDGNSYKIRDCKLARNVDESHHPEILHQLELYGWLFESTFKMKPTKLEIYLGDKTIKEFEYSGGETALKELEKIISLSNIEEEPYSPVGWSKCMSCGFRERCWRIAEDLNDVALVYELDQATAIALKEKSITNINDLVTSFNEESLSELQKPHGKKFIKVGKRARRILQQANSLLNNEELLIGKPEIPLSENYVMFDLEGLPPQFDDIEKVYLWGIQIFGKRPSDFIPSLAGFGESGDKEGWIQFLINCEMIFNKYGNIPFIHWANYEIAKVNLYIKRYGDRNGIAQRVLDNCVDLLKITRDSIVLPEYSYSLKVIEKRIGFERTQQEYGGDWSIAQYIKAVETNNKLLRVDIMNDILKYNEEDLRATWAVFEWLRNKFNKV